ncbi:MAG: N-acetylmuramoyl-L-alanine amidase [Bacteroidota bacterium]
MIKSLYRFFFIIAVAVMTLAVASSALAEDYLSIKAQSGDGIYSILRRYKLDSHRCNFDKFYSLNSLRKNAGLIVGRNYQLPIAIHRYDGKSIRTTLGINDWDTAVLIRDYNRDLENLGLAEGPYEDTRTLYLPHHILNCSDSTVEIPAPVRTDPEQVTPPAATTAPGTSGNSATASGGRRNFPIFGKDYAYTPLASTKLRGKVYYIVGGHGGPDPGAVGTRAGHQLCEDEYAYDVALRLCRNLIAHGATAYMINRDANDGIRNEKYLDCDTDEVVWGDIRQSPNQKIRLTQRSDVINELYNKHRLQGVTEQRMVVIHVDSRSTSQRTDVFFYHHPSSEEGKSLARQIQRTMRQKYRRYRSNGEYRGTVTARDLHMLRECSPVGVYVELANIRNQHDQQRIVLQRNRELLAEWMLEGLMNH